MHISFAKRRVWHSTIREPIPKSSTRNAITAIVVRFQLASVTVSTTQWNKPIWVRHLAVIYQQCRLQMPFLQMKSWAIGQSNAFDMGHSRTLNLLQTACCTITSAPLLTQANVNKHACIFNKFGFRFIGLIYFIFFTWRESRTHIVILK